MKYSITAFKFSFISAFCGFTSYLVITGIGAILYDVSLEILLIMALPILFVLLLSGFITWGMVNTPKWLSILTLIIASLVFSVVVPILIQSKLASIKQWSYLFFGCLISLIPSYLLLQFVIVPRLFSFTRRNDKIDK